MYAKPIFNKESVVHFSTIKVYLLRMFFILVLGGTFFIVLTGSGSQQEAVEDLYYILFMIMLYSAYLIGPAFSSAAVSVEKQKNTLGLLFLTDLSPGEIVVGKFFSRFSYIALMLVSALPILIFGVAIGGSTYGDVFAVMLIIIAQLYMVTALTILYSVLLKRNILVMVVSYLSLFVLVGVPWSVGGLWSWFSAPFAIDQIASRYLLMRDPSAFTYILYNVGFAFAAGTFFLVLCSWIVKRATDWDFFSFLSVVMKKTDAIFRFVSFETFGMSEKHLTSKFKNPFAWKETNARLFLRGKYLVRLIALFIAVSLYLYYASSAGMIETSAMDRYIRPSMTYHHLFLTLESIALLLVVTVLASSSIIAEKENQVIDVLLTTPMNPSVLINGKYYGMLRNMAFFAFLPALHLGAFTLAGVINPAAAVCFLIFLYGCFALAISQGLYASLHAKSTFQAVVWGVLANLYLMGAMALYSFTAILPMSSRNAIEGSLVVIIVVTFFILLALGASAVILKKTRDKFLSVLREKDIDFDELLAG